jgi:leucyl aminopeptidase
LNPSLQRAKAGGEACPLHLVTEPQLPALLASLPPLQSAWLRAQKFEAERFRVLSVPAADGHVAAAVVGLGPTAEALGWWDGAALRERLPEALYRFSQPWPAPAATELTLGWLLGGYRFASFRSQGKAASAARLVVPEHADLAYAEAAATAISQARDLINTPANALGPEELATAAAQLAQQTGGQCHITSGEALQREFPLVHAVGLGSARSPRLIDCRWPRSGAPRITLVGKGVCFDSGGLDIKPAAGMLLMKKDMGGAACALALARLLRQLDVPVQLRVLIPAVENSVGSNAYRPGDIWRSRKGLTVEIGNTDAEGRLVLADALSLADEETPDLLIDMATLTGAARVALGPDLPAVFGPDTALVQQLLKLGDELHDPLWPLPLWGGYDEDLASRVADINNMASTPYAGAVMAALFLKRFVTATPSWLHVDLFAWNPKERPGRPLGGEAQCVRALFALICRRFDLRGT